MNNPRYRKYRHTGMVTDLPPEEVSPSNWTNCSNIEFIDGASRRVSGYSYYVGCDSIQPTFALNVVYNNISYWIYCGHDTIGVTDGSTNYDITPVSGLSTVDVGSWNATILNGLPVLNNGVDAPIFWDLDTSHKCVSITGWPANTSCKVIRSFKYHLFALNITTGGISYPNTLWWSNSADNGAIPTQWTPSTTNDAGDMILSDSTGSIQDGLAMRDSFVVYKDSSTYSLNYVAGQYIYTSRKNFLTTGVLTSNCIVEINGTHWIFTGSDVIQTDGQSFTSVVQYKVKNEIVNSLDPTKIQQSCVVHDKANNQVWVCITEQDIGLLSKAYIINTDTLEVGVRVLPSLSYLTKGLIPDLGVSMIWDTDSDSWDSDTTTWNQASYSIQQDSIMYCKYDNYSLYKVGGTTNNGNQIYAYLERLSLPINEKDIITRNLIIKVFPRIQGTNGDIINISIGSQGSFGDGITWTNDIPYSIGDQYVDCHIEGRLLSIKFSSDITNNWKVQSYQLETIEQGIF